jgi:uncharacterized protein YegJ (DUF2314 family)
VWGSHVVSKLTKIRQKRVEELEKRLKSMEEQLHRANQTKQVVKVVEDRDALEHLWEEGLTNFGCRMAAEGSQITEITGVEDHSMFYSTKNIS